MNGLLVDNLNNTDPVLNLALEEYVVRSLSVHRSFVLLYVNEPAVVLGKHQNAAEEANLGACEAKNIPLLRRISGGGTVYHDLGNLNFSFITEQNLKNVNKYDRFLNPVIEVLRDYRLPAELDVNNNIVIRNKKVSGNAQFTSTGRLLTHGTLLFKSNLQQMRQLLTKDNSKQVVSHATKSRPAEVANIVDLYPGSNLTFKQFKADIQNKLFDGPAQSISISKSEWAAVSALADEIYRSWQWNYGRSPGCKIFLHREGHKIELEIENGQIKKMAVASDSRLQSQLKKFIGTPYIVSKIKEIAGTSKEHDGMSWESIIKVLF